MNKLLNFMLGIVTIGIGVGMFWQTVDVSQTHPTFYFIFGYFFPLSISLVVLGISFLYKK